MDPNSGQPRMSPLPNTTLPGQQPTHTPQPYANSTLPLHATTQAHTPPGGGSRIGGGGGGGGGEGGVGGIMLSGGDGARTQHPQNGSGGLPLSSGNILHPQQQSQGSGPPPQPNHYVQAPHTQAQQHQQNMHHHSFGGGMPFGGQLSQPPSNGMVAAISQYPLPSGQDMDQGMAQGMAVHQQHQQQQQLQQAPQYGMAGGIAPNGQSQAGFAPPQDALSPGAGSGQGLPGTAQSLKPIRRRRRMITSCLECRRRKLKCDKQKPCTNCTKFGRECVSLGPKLDEDSLAKLTQIKEKVGSLERQFERAVAQRSTSASEAQSILADEVESEFDGERDLQQTPMVALDLTYEDDAKDDDILDLGIKIGKMRITERIGGLSRPRISEEISAGLQQGIPGGRQQPTLVVEDPHAPDFLKPTDAYLPPTGNFFMGQGDALPNIMTFLLERRQFDRLILQYFEAVHPVARCVHRESFMQDYQSFWMEIEENIEPHGSIQAIVFAALLSAAVSMDEEAVRNEIVGNEKTNLVQLLKVATETALCKANFLRTSRVSTLQGFIMYMIPLCREEVSRSHSVLVGAAVRIAECMGLHRDGEGYGLSPVETHVRRLIWHQLCFLDIRTCEAQGPKPSIRREDYDTKIPMNCEDEDLVGHDQPPQPRQGWTSALLSLIRFEINEMMRNIWTDRRKLEMNKITLVQVLAKMEKFRRRLFEKYEKFLDDSVPIQRYAKLVMILLTARLHAMVLHPYFANTSNPLPQRLSDLLITSGVTILEVAIDLGSNPMFSTWAWYLGAYQQYQIALLLATEIYYRPHNKLADRIWRCLEYVFEIQEGLPPEAKGPIILQEIMGKTAWYRSMRRVRAPKGTAGAIPSPQAALVKGDMPPALQAPSPHQGVSPPQGQMGQQPRMGPPGPSMGGGPPGFSPPPGPPPPEVAMVFAGVSNGESIWSIPRMPESPENTSDCGNSGNQSMMSMQPGGMIPDEPDFGDVEMMNSLFPYDPQTGIIQSFGINSTPYAFGG